jgi:citrate lyase subunit beta/citryl-CoA lyase
MPGSNARALEKGRTLPADAIIIDLEDAVAPDAKDAARAQAAEAIKAGGFGPREMVLRANAPDTEWFDADLAVAAQSGADAVAVPKISDPETLVAIGRRLDALGAPRGLKVWAMIETPLAVLRIERIAFAAHDPVTRLAVLMMGTNDLSKETGARIVPGRAPMLAWLSTCVLAAKAAGIGILDSVWNDFRDLDGFAAECRQAADLGFNGKTLIHPSQIAGANAAFTPPEAEVDEARRVIELFARPENAGIGVLQVEGRMYERMHADIARRTVALADAIAARS